jgi:CelD/BcsL family acetyltransferase involved in cellulose biosynthesis
MLEAVDIELVTDVDRLEELVPGWEALAGRVSEPRSCGAVVAGWARHMMSADAQLHIWVALDGPEVVGVLPFVTDPMARKRLRLFPPARDMMFGVVPIAHPDCARQVTEAIADDFVARAEAVDLASIYWLPEDSLWSGALGGRLAESGWVTADRTRYGSFATYVPAGMDAWMAARDKVFRQGVGRRARRAEEQGFRLHTTEDVAQIMERLDSLQAFYLRSQEGRAGEGYRFDQDMARAIGRALALSPSGRFALSVLERDDALIGASLALRAGTVISCWLIGYEPEWSRFGPGVAALLESVAAGERAGYDTADLGLGDHHYLRDFKDISVPLQSLTWCRPRLARLLQFGSSSAPTGEGGSMPQQPY